MRDSGSRQFSVAKYEVPVIIILRANGAFAIDRAYSVKVLAENLVFLLHQQVSNMMCATSFGPAYVALVGLAVISLG